ncbi:hypothetical protein [Candidatus Regiella insecticola]
MFIIMKRSGWYLAMLEK